MRSGIALSPQGGGADQNEGSVGGIPFKEDQNESVRAAAFRVEVPPERARTLRKKKRSALAVCPRSLASRRIRNSPADLSGRDSPVPLNGRTKPMVRQCLDRATPAHDRQRGDRARCRASACVHRSRRWKPGRATARRRLDEPADVWTEPTGFRQPCLDGVPTSFRGPLRSVSRSEYRNAKAGEGAVKTPPAALAPRVHMQRFARAWA